MDGKKCGNALQYSLKRQKNKEKALGKAKKSLYFIEQGLH
jgi:hypothetical protein